MIEPEQQETRMKDEELNELSESSRVLVFREEISEESIQNIRERILRMAITSSEPSTMIKLLIDCNGGACEFALILADFLCSFQIPVIGVVNGACKSSSIIVLLGCAKRLATPHSQFYLHNTLASFEYTPDETHYEQRRKTHINRSREIINQMWEFIALRTGMKKKNIRQLARRGEYHEWSFSSKDAKKFGLIDDIIQPDEFALLTSTNGKNNK